MGGGPGFAWEGLSVASGSGSLARRATGGSPNPVGNDPGGRRVRLPAASASGSLARRAAVLRHRSAASPRRMCGRRVKCDSVPRRVCGQWHCPRDCRIMSVTLFHSQTSYCAEAGRAAFCGTPAAHLPNGDRFGGGIAVRQQGGGEGRGGMRETAGKERATTIAARSWRRSRRISSPLSFFAPPSGIAALKTTPFASNRRPWQRVIVPEVRLTRGTCATRARRAAVKQANTRRDEPRQTCGRARVGPVRPNASASHDRRTETQGPRTGKRLGPVRPNASASCNPPHGNARPAHGRAAIKRANTRRAYNACKKATAQHGLPDAGMQSFFHAVCLFSAILSNGKASMAASRAVMRAF